MYGYLPGGVFEHDQYGLCMVTDVVCDPADDINQTALFEAAYDILRTWPDSVPQRFPDPRLERESFLVGVPREVRFEPFPRVLECQRCGHVETLDQVRTVAGPPRCTRANCNGTFRQLPFVQIHNCGRIESLYVRGCRRHGRQDLVFVDTGRVYTSTWRCRSCGNAAIGTPRMTPCSCEWSQRETEYHKKSLRIVRSNDSSIFYPQTRSFVNLKEDKLSLLRGDEQACGLLLARAWGLLEEKAVTIAQRRASIRSHGEASERVDPLVQKLIDELGSDSPAVQQFLADRAAQRHLPGQDAVDQVVEMLGESATLAPPSRRLVEHVAVLDTLRSWTVDDAIEMAQDRGDDLGALALVEAKWLARESLGLVDMRCLFDFPMALCAVGYTRAANDPERATLRPFQATSAEGKTPIYALAADTEALLFQLDPARVASWLYANGLVSEKPPTLMIDAWAWIRQNLAELSAERWEQEAWNRQAVRLTRTLLHTISHLLLRHIEWSGFDPESIGEYILPETLAIVLHTNRYTDFTIGGLVTLFEQRLLNWLESVRVGGISCLYDPFCADEGGSCVGCLHRRYNCQFFNEDLSRAALYGGVATDGTVIEHGYWPI